MGKTVISSQFQYLQVPVYNADTVVHKLLDENKKVIDLIKRYFPQTLKNGNIDRNLLGDIVFKNDKSLEILEQIIYPYLHINKTKFLTICARRKCKMVILDVPLLYEKNGHHDCNYVIVVTAPYFLQLSRVLKRPRMTEKKFTDILSRQLPNSDKCKKADFIIHTGLGKYYSLQKAKQIKETLLNDKELTNHCETAFDKL